MYCTLIFLLFFLVDVVQTRTTGDNFNNWKGKPNHGFGKGDGPGSARRGEQWRHELRKMFASDVLGSAVDYTGGFLVVKDAEVPFKVQERTYNWGELYHGPSYEYRCTIPFQKIVEIKDGDPAESLVLPDKAIASVYATTSTRIQFSNGSAPELLSWGCRAIYEKCCGLDCCDEWSLWKWLRDPINNVGMVAFFVVLCLLALFFWFCFCTGNRRKSKEDPYEVRRALLQHWYGLTELIPMKTEDEQEENQPPGSYQSEAVETDPLVEEIQSNIIMRAVLPTNEKCETPPVQRSERSASGYMDSLAPLVSMNQSPLPSKSSDKDKPKAPPPSPRMPLVDDIKQESKPRSNRSTPRGSIILTDIETGHPVALLPSTPARVSMVNYPFRATERPPLIRGLRRPIIDEAPAADYGGYLPADVPIHSTAVQRKISKRTTDQQL